MYNRRMTPTAGATRQPTTPANGRSYPTNVAYTDVNNCDADVLLVNGWDCLAQSVGPTSSRPALTPPGTPGGDWSGVISSGWRHYDTTLSKMVIWASDGTWRDPANGNAV